MQNLKSVFIWTLVSVIFIGAQPVFASSFGISPPYVRNQQLARSTAYEQRIILVRSNPIETLKAEVTINVPGAEDWITIDKGKEFLLPAGENRVPMMVKVNVPSKAKFGDYSGTIRIRLLPGDDEARASGVSIVLGAQIDVSLNVVDIKIYEVKVNSFKLKDAEEGRYWWWLYFPGKIEAVIRVENIGNVHHGPSSVKLEIYRLRSEELLETTESIEKLGRVEPFKEETVTANIPTNLPPGSYRAKYFVMDGEKVIRDGALSINILPEGSLLGYSGFGFAGLSSTHKTSVVSLALGLLLLLMIGVYRIIGILRRKKE